MVLVCRASATGTWAATGAVEQWAAKRLPHGVNLLGLVAVAASDRKPPAVVADRLKLFAGWLPAVWRVDWVETLLAADNPRDVGMPPDVEALRHAIGRAMHTERTA